MNTPGIRDEETRKISGWEEKIPGDSVKTLVPAQPLSRVEEGSNSFRIQRSRWMKVALLAIGRQEGEVHVEGEALMMFLQNVC